MDSQRPNTVPTAEPTPDSPAPTQTSPVSPAKPLASRLPSPHPGTSPRKLMIAIIAVVVLIAALIFLFLSPWSPFVPVAPSGPRLRVGQHSYINVCSVFDRALAAKELDIKSDVNKENTAESFSYDPANTQDKEVDLLKLAESDSIFSTCMLKLDRMQEGSGKSQSTSFVNVTAAVKQFADEHKASAAFKEEKQKTPHVKTLPDFADSSYYAPPQARYADTPAALQPRLLHKNMIIIISIPVDDQDKSNGEQDVPHVQTLFKDITARIDRGEGERPKNFSGINKIGGNKFADACTTINYAKVAAALGHNTQFDVQAVSGNQAFAPDNNGGQTPNQLTSACTFYFRTQYEIDQLKNYKPSTGSNGRLEYSDRFPHSLSAQLAVTESPAQAQEFLKAARKEADKSAGNNTDGNKTSVGDLKLGDGGIKVTVKKQYQSTAAGTAGSESHGELYYITKGPHIYILAVNYLKQATPYKSEIKKLDTDQIKKIYKEMTMATKRAN